MNNRYPWMSGGKRSFISFYREQLRKFNKLGLGRKTEHGVVVTERLIKATERRIKELKASTKKKLSKYVI